MNNKEEDTHEALKIYKKMMTVSGIWPQKNSTSFYKFKLAISWLFALSFFAVLCLQIYCNLNNYRKISEVTYTTIVIFCYLIKFAVITFNKKIFLEALELVKDPIFSSYPKELSAHVKKAVDLSNLIGKTYQYSIVGVVCFYSIYPIAFHQTFPVPFPYDFGKYNFLMYIYQVVSIGVAAWNDSCLDLLIISFIGIANAQFEILARKMIMIKAEEKVIGFDSEADAEVIRQLRQCVRHHLAILDFVDMIENIFTVALFAQLLSTALIMCNIIFHIVLLGADYAQTIVLFNAFVANQIELFLFCWFGNELITKSSAIGEACYFFKWYNCSPMVRKYLFIIMERAKRPSQITALQFMDLSFTTYLAVIQWSYSCFTLLLNMYQT